VEHDFGITKRDMSQVKICFFYPTWIPLSASLVAVPRSARDAMQKSCVYSIENINLQNQPTSLIDARILILFSLVLNFNTSLKLAAILTSYVTVLKRTGEQFSIYNYCTTVNSHPSLNYRDISTPSSYEFDIHIYLSWNWWYPQKWSVWLLHTSHKNKSQVSIPPTPPRAPIKPRCASIYQLYLIR
jgi:hypothetical protein